MCDQYGCITYEPVFAVWHICQQILLVSIHSCILPAWDVVGGGGYIDQTRPQGGSELIWFGST